MAAVVTETASAAMEVALTPKQALSSLAARSWSMPPQSAETEVTALVLGGRLCHSIERQPWSGSFWQFDNRRHRHHIRYCDWW